MVEREVCWPSGKLPTDLCPQMNRYTSFYAAEQIPADPKDQAKVADTWWQAKTARARPAITSKR